MSDYSKGAELAVECGALRAENQRLSAELEKAKGERAEAVAGNVRCLRDFSAMGLKYGDLEQQNQALREGLRDCIRQLENYDQEPIGAYKDALASAQALLGDAKEKDPRYYSARGYLYWGHPCNIAHLILQLQTLDPEMKVSTVMFVDIGGKKKSRAVGLSMSRERWDDAGWLDFTLPGPEALAIWAYPRTPADGLSPDEPTGTADDLIPSATVDAIPEAIRWLAADLDRVRVDPIEELKGQDNGKKD